jgi:outer membrane protein OmpA-like peptidoglycan-associated protein
LPAIIKKLFFQKNPYKNSNFTTFAKHYHLTKTNHMSKIPWWLTLLALAGYTYWSVNYWHCYKCQCCNGKDPAAVAKSTGVPMFQWSAALPDSNTAFAQWKKALLAKGGQGDTLLITGLYRAAETGADAKNNLGMLRAAALQSLMMPEMPESRMQLASRAVSDDWAAGAGARENAEFSWKKMVLKQEQGAIIESDNAVTFLFPFNSTEKDKDPAVDAYLSKLVEKHKSTQATFTIVGHTDNVGEDAENQRLGQGRADAIARIMTQLGIAPARIKTSSKGEAEPVADNNTDDGRHQNRRVVITVNQ